MCVCIYVSPNASHFLGVVPIEQPKGNEGGAQQTLIPVTVKMIADALAAFKNEGLEDLKIDGAEVKNVRPAPQDTHTHTYTYENEEEHIVLREFGAHEQRASRPCRSVKTPPLERV